MKKTRNLALGENIESSWNGINRRREKRWYLPIGILKLEVSSNGKQGELIVTNLSMSGLGGRITEDIVREGTVMELHHRETGIRFKARAERVLFSRVGMSSADKAVLGSLIESVKEKHATQLHHRKDGEIVVEGFLGIGAHHEMRREMRFNVIDLSQVHGMDLFGLGILFAHQENGARISGCKGKIKHLLGLSRFCDTCTPHNPGRDCPRYGKATGGM